MTSIRLLETDVSDQRAPTVAVRSQCAVGRWLSRKAADSLLRAQQREIDAEIGLLSALLLQPGASLRALPNQRPVGRTGAACVATPRARASGRCVSESARAREAEVLEQLVLGRVATESPAELVLGLLALVGHPLEERQCPSSQRESDDRVEGYVGNDAARAEARWPPYPIREPREGDEDAERDQTVAERVSPPKLIYPALKLGVHGGHVTRDARGARDSARFLSAANRCPNGRFGQRLRGVQSGPPRCSGTSADCEQWMREVGFRETYVTPLAGRDSMVLGIR